MEKLELMSNYSKVNINNQLLSYTNNKGNWKFKTQYCLHQHPKIKFLGINLTRYIQDRYEENYKTWMTKIKSQINEEKFPVYEREDSILSGCQFFPI